MRGQIIHTVPGEEFKVCLRRTSLTQPWGFRLQGGSDIGFPLTVQRVFSGSPAEGVLHRGDICLQIDNFEASHILHKEAQDLVRLANTELVLYLKRSPGNRASSVPSRSGSQDLTPTGCNNHSASSPGYSSLSRAPMRLPQQHQSRATFQPSNRGSKNSFDNHNGNNNMMTQSLSFQQNDHPDNEEEEPYVYVPVSERKKVYQPNNQNRFSSAPRVNRPINQFSFNQRSQSHPNKGPASSSTRWQPNPRSASSPSYKQTSSSSTMWQPNRNQNWAPQSNQNRPTVWEPKNRWAHDESSVANQWQPHGNNVESDSRRQSKSSITLTPSYQPAGSNPVGSNRQIWQPQREEPVHHSLSRGISYNVPVKTVISNDQYRQQPSSHSVHHTPSHNYNSYASRPLNVTVPHQSSTSENGMTIIQNYHPLEMSRINFYPAYPANMNVRRNPQGSQSIPASPNYALQTSTYMRQEPLYQHKRSTRALSVEPNGGVKPTWHSTGAPSHQQPLSSQPSPSQWVSSSNLYNPPPSNQNSLARPRREIHQHQRGTSVPHDWGDPPAPSVFSQNRHQHHGEIAHVNTGDYDWSKSELAKLIYQEDMKQKHRPIDYPSPERFEPPPVVYRQNAPQVRTINRSSWTPGQQSGHNYRNSAEYEGTEF